MCIRDRVMVPELALAVNDTDPDTQTVDGVTDADVTVGNGWTVAVTVVREADTHPLCVASAYNVVLELIVVGGITTFPPVGASYQVMVPELALAVNDTDPDTQTVDGVTDADVTVGNGFSIITALPVIELVPFTFVPLTV